jgi:hypothetical protein
MNYVAKQQITMNYGRRPNYARSANYSEANYGEAKLQRSHIRTTHTLMPQQDFYWRLCNSFQQQPVQLKAGLKSYTERIFPSEAALLQQNFASICVL